MTREEKEQTGKYVLQMARLLEDGCYQQEMLLKAVHIIDEALEQEPILNKIRVEIDIARFIDKDTKLCKNANASGLEVALQIIDKYKGE